MARKCEETTLLSVRIILLPLVNMHALHAERDIVMANTSVCPSVSPESNSIRQGFLNTKPHVWCKSPKVKNITQKLLQAKRKYPVKGIRHASKKKLDSERH